MKTTFPSAALWPANSRRAFATASEGAAGASRSLVVLAATLAATSAAFADLVSATPPNMTCDANYDVAFFRWPSNISFSTLETDDFPHYANMTNAFADVVWTSSHPRITKTDQAAYWQTIEAIWQRRFFPSLTEFGAADCEDRPFYELDFIPEGTTVKNLTNTLNLVTFDSGVWTLGNASRRDFSTCLGRISYVSDLLDRWALGSLRPSDKTTQNGYPVSMFSTPLDESRKERGEHYWLVPERHLADAAPPGTWVKDAPLETANWNEHLVGLGELESSTNFFWALPYGHKPFDTFGTENVLTNLMPQWARDYCDWRRIKRFDSLFDHTYGHSLRGRALNLALKDLCLQQAKSDDFWLPQRRISPYRWSFANDIAAVCERSIDGYDVVSWTEPTNETNAVTFPHGKMARFRFDEEVYSGDVMAKAMASNATFRLTIPSEGMPTLCLNSQRIEFSEISGSTTNHVVETNIVEHTVDGWRDINQQLGIAGYAVDLPIYSQAVTDYTFEIDQADEDTLNEAVWRLNTHPDGYKAELWVDLRETPWKLNLRVRGIPPYTVEGWYWRWSDGSTALPVGTMPRFETSMIVSNVVGDISFSYAANYIGRTPVGGARAETVSYPLSDWEGWRAAADTGTLRPIYRASALSGFWRSTLYGFATCGVSTDLAVTTEVITNGTFTTAARSYRTTLFNRHWKECSVNAASGSHQEDLVRDRKMQLEFCAAKVASNCEEPGRDVADRPTVAGISNILTQTVRKLDVAGWGMKPNSPEFEGEVRLQIPFTTTYSNYNKHMTIKISASDVESNPLCRLSFVVADTVSGDDKVQPRYSKAAAYEVRPVVVTDWKFPSMRPKDDE